MEVNIHEAKTHLSKLLERVALGEEVMIAEAGTEVAKLVPIDTQPKTHPRQREKGSLRFPMTSMIRSPRKSKISSTNEGFTRSSHISVADFWNRETFPASG